MIGPWFLIKLLLPTGWVRAAAVTLIQMVLVYALTLPMALLVRARCVEAFVVPTGAMAPTILGWHTRLTCENCGCVYDFNTSEWAMRPASRSDERRSACPVCGEKAVVTPSAKMLRGDRIMVDKNRRPRRWELVVFRYPEDPSVNYVKRLVALPGETVEVFDGDVFINGRRQRKEPGTAEDMWVLVHDGRYRPKKPSPEAFRWEPAGDSRAWQPAGQGWTLADEAASPQSLAFCGTITDALAFNDVSDYAKAKPLLRGDVKIECVLEQFSGQGSLGFSWQFAGDRATASVSAGGEVVLTVEGPDSQNPSQPRKTEARATLSKALAAGSRLVFAVRDGLAYVGEAVRPVVERDVGPQDLEAVRRCLPRDEQPCRLALTAERCRVTLARLAVFKELSYRTLWQIGGYPLPEQRRGDGSFTLGPDEYYVLGDNSARSKDSRFWGSVSDDAIIGVARWIYWPAHRCRAFQ